MFGRGGWISANVIGQGGYEKRKKKKRRKCGRKRRKTKNKGEVEVRIVNANGAKIKPRRMHED